jgi:hypothetical protein
LSIALLYVIGVIGTTAAVEKGINKAIAEIVVDEEYLILNYEGLWQREGDL